MRETLRIVIHTPIGDRDRFPAGQFAFGPPLLLPIVLASALIVGPVVISADAVESAPTAVEAASSQVLVRVNGAAITEGDVQFLMLSRKTPAELQAQLRPRFIEQLIDQRLMQEYLARRSTKADPRELDGHVARILELIRKGGDEPKTLLARLGYTEKTLRDALALPVAWKTHVARVVTSERLRTYFQEHRPEFDGTEVRASHIVVKVPTDRESDELRAAEEKLQTARREIADGKLTFAAAAAKYSEGPSAADGGDIGYFACRGTMPTAFTQVAFALKPGELSRPFRTPFGVHLCTVTDRKPGDLSLEDVRPLVLNQLAEELWNETVKQEREKAKIEWAAPP